MKLLLAMTLALTLAFPTGVDGAAGVDEPDSDLCAAVSSGSDPSVAPEGTPTAEVQPATVTPTLSPDATTAPDSAPSATQSR